MLKKCAAMFQLILKVVILFYSFYEYFLTNFYFSDAGALHDAENLLSSIKLWS